MLRLCIGNYEYSVEHDLRNYRISFRPADQSDTVDEVKSFDDMLHESIDKIFREDCLSNSDKIKEYLRNSQHDTDQNPIIKSILQIMPSNSLKKLSLLSISVLAGYKKTAELLVRSGADVNVPFGRHDPQVIDEKWTVLHVLLQMDPSPENEQLIRLIVNHGADLQVRDHMGKTVLHYAVREGRVQMTEMLLEKGADVNAADDDGLTPLFETVLNSKADELVPLLIKNGADVFAKFRDDENALHRLGRMNPQIHAAVVARLFIEKGVSLHDKSKNYQLQPLHLAAWNRNDELVNVFLDHGADVNAQIYDGMIPLYFAIMSENNAAVVKTLIKRGANVNQMLNTDCFRTALHFACETFCEEYIRLLLSAGADVSIENDYGKTPLALILTSENRENSSSVKSIVAVLALKKVCQPAIELKDEKIIEKYPTLLKYYRNCIEETEERMKSTRFIETCTFHELLTKCQCHIAGLMRNQNFETKFKLYLSEFPIYRTTVIPEIFERAQNHYYSMLEQEEVISEAVYHILPYEIVRKIAHYTFNCCENVKQF